MNVKTLYPRGPVDLVGAEEEAKLTQLALWLNAG
jgi:hypothetical protein